MDRLKDWVNRGLGQNSRLLLEAYYFGRCRLFYTGQAHLCPCCGSRLSRFLPAVIGSQGTVAAIRCPRCDSHPRHRLLWLFLKEHRPSFFADAQSLLHIAPEFCFQRRFRTQANLHYVTGDLALPRADIRLDLTELPFAEGSFDVVFCNHVLEHVLDDCRAVRELFRVLRPGGWGILQVPVEPNRAVTFEDWSVTTPDERSRYFGQEDHVRQYGADYPDRLRSAGFEVDVVAYVGSLTEHLVEYYGLKPAEPVYLCRKPVCGDGSA